MWGINNDIREEAGITLIANNCEIVGDVCFSDQLQINGIVKGNVYAKEGSKAAVTISKHGIVQGEVRVPNVVVNGQVVGDIHSDKHVELADNAKIKGNVYYNLIEMVMGSRVDGNLVHVVDEGASKQLENEPVQTPQVVAAEPGIA
jgi:cytoskeletal protein CcmA (bactofilin family)